MIDFRYHVVSLVSVFIALAVGIVLGAGPLKAGIGDTLTTEVDRLRTEKTNLRSDLDTANSSVANRDTFTGALVPTLVSDQLSGDALVVVELPGADTATLRRLIETLQVAGATVTGHLRITDAWTDPDQAQARDDLLRQARASSSSSPSASSGPSASSSASPGATATATTAATAPTTVGRLPGPVPAVPGSTGTDTGLARLLAAAVLTGDRTQTGTRDPAGRVGLDALVKAGLVELDGDFLGRGSQAVVLAPPVPQDTTPVPSAAERAAARTLSWTALCAGLDAAGGVIVTGPASAAGGSGLVASVRGVKEVNAAVSTVDTAGTPMGDITTVLALHEQLQGRAGRYGFTGSVDGPLPSGLLAAPVRAAATAPASASPSAAPASAAVHR